MSRIAAHLDVFHAVADPTRRAILDLLRVRERLTAGEIAAEFDAISRPAVSKHLRVLRQAGLVAHERRGRQRVHRLNPEPLRELDRWLTQYKRFWQSSLERLKAHVEADPEGPDE